MMNTIDLLKRSIAKLEKERPDSPSLKDFREQLAALESNPEMTAQQLYFSGNPVVPTSQPATDATDSTAASQPEQGQALNLPPEDPTAKWSPERYQGWLKEHPPGPISPEVEKQVRDLM